jgi:hypothetical protein
MTNEIQLQNSFAYNEFAYKGHFLQADKTLWAAYNEYAYIKYPLHDLNAPTKSEIEQIFKKKNPLLISYAVKTDLIKHNAYLYLCSSFQVSQLKDNFIRNIRKAEKIFTVKQINPAEILEIGLQCYTDTRKRIGLDDGTEKHFIDRFNTHHQRKNITYIGAFTGNELASFASLMLYKDLVEIESIFGRNDFLPNRPNDLLIYSILNQALNIEKLNYVSYGFASIQENNNEEGLHQFKLKCGFEAIPVKRIFLFQPKYRLLFGRFTKFVVKLLLKLFKKNTLLRKLNGILNQKT